MTDQTTATTATTATTGETTEATEDTTETTPTGVRISAAPWARAEVQSPCVKVCMLHPTERICVGCYRSGEEIARWSRMTDAERSAVLTELPGRAPRVAARRRGGRRSRVAEG